MPAYFRCLILLTMLTMLFCSACISRRDPIPWDRWRESYPASYDMPLASKADLLEKHLLASHLSPEGVLIFMRAPGPLVPGQPDAYFNLSDTPIWQGCFTAMLAFRYHFKRSTADRDLLLKSLEGMRLLHEVTGKPGLIARGIFPAGFQIPREDVDGEWRDAPPPHEAWRYRGDVSRDQYFGFLFGMTAVTQTLGIDDRSGDEGVRDSLKSLILPIADHFWDNDSQIIDVDGERTTHGNLQGYTFCIPLGPNAGLMLGYQLLAYRLSGEEKYRERYDELIERDYHQALNTVKFEIFGNTNHNNDNMAFMALYALTQLETDPELLAAYDASLDKLWSYIRHEGNCYWHLIYATRRQLPEFATFDLRENLRLFPPETTIRPIDLLGRKEIDRGFWNDRFGRPKNRTALPAHVRKYGGDFMWKNCPFALRDSFGDGWNLVGSGADYLLPYWMCRYYLGDPEAIVGHGDQATP